MPGTTIGSSDMELKKFIKSYIELLYQMDQLIITIGSIYKNLNQIKSTSSKPIPDIYFTAISELEKIMEDNRMHLMGKNAWLYKLEQQSTEIIKDLQLSKGSIN